MDFNHFDSAGVDIAYLDLGEGEPILLIHGFGSNILVNWGATGWIDTLRRAGRRVIAMDVRGHGQSQKFYDPADYTVDQMARDGINLLDHLGIDRADVFGFSMGARIAAFLALAAPAKVRSLVIGGLGMALVDGMGGEEEIIAALRAPTLDEVTGDRGRAYRKFSEQTGSDRMALAACMRFARDVIRAERLAELAMPVLIAVGEKDTVAGSAEELGRLIPGSHVFIIPRRDHMLSTGAQPFKDRVLQFLDERP